MLKVILILILILQITTYGRSEEIISAPEQTNISETLNSNIGKPHKSQKLLDVLKTKKGTSGETNEDIARNTQANIKAGSGSHESDVLPNENNKNFQNDTGDLPDSNKESNSNNNSDQDSSGETNENLTKDTQANIKQLSLDSDEKDVLLNQNNKSLQNSNQKSSINSDAKEEEKDDITASDNHNESTLNTDTMTNKNVKNENPEHETAKSVNISNIKQTQNGEEDVQNTHKSKEDRNEITAEVKRKQEEHSINDHENKYLPKSLNQTHYMSISNDFGNRMLNISANIDKKLNEKVGHGNTKNKTPDSAGVTKKGNSITDKTHIQQIAKSKSNDNKTHIQHIVRSKGIDEAPKNVARRRQGPIKKKPKPNHAKLKPPSRSHTKPPNKNRSQSRPKQTNPLNDNNKTSNKLKADAVNVTSDSKLNNSRNEDKGIGESDRQDKAENCNSNSNKVSKTVQLAKNNNNGNNRFQDKINIQNKYLKFYEQYTNEVRPWVKGPIKRISHHNNEKELNLTYSLKKGTRLSISLTFDVLKSKSEYIQSSGNKNKYKDNSKLKQILHDHGNLNKGVRGTNDDLKIGVKVKVTLIRNRPEFNFIYYNSSASVHWNSSDYSNATTLMNDHDANNTLIEEQTFNLNTVTVKEKPKESIKQRPIESIKQRPKENIKERPKENIKQRPKETIKRRPNGNVKRRHKAYVKRKPKIFTHYQTYDQEYRSLRYKRELKYTNTYNHPQTLEQARTNSKIPNTHKRSSDVTIPLHNLQKLSLIPRDYGNKDISNIGNTPSSQKFLVHKLNRSGWKAFMNYKFGKSEIVSCNRCGSRKKLQSLNPASFNHIKFYPKSKNLKYYV